MKVLISGGAGFIGSNIATLLEQKGAKVIILDDFSNADFTNAQTIKGEIIRGDIIDKKIFKKLPKCDAVIHQAAITDTTLKNDAKMMAVNYKGFKNILYFCLKKEIKLIYASSAGVYGDGPSPMKENQKLRPLNMYAYSKYLCDYSVQKIINKAKSLVVGLRYFNVYGPGEYHKGKSASMVYQLYLQMKNNFQPRIFKFGEQKRDFIYVKDVARITIEALKLKKSIILNVGTGIASSFNEIIYLLNKALKKNLEPDYFDNPHKSAYQDFTQADISLLKQFKLTPTLNLRDGVSDYVNKYLLSI